MQALGFAYSGGMDGVDQVPAILEEEFMADHCSRPLPEPRQIQNQNQNQRRSAYKGTNDDGFLNEGTTSRRPLFEARARSTNGSYGVHVGLGYSS